MRKKFRTQIYIGCMHIIYLVKASPMYPFEKDELKKIYTEKIRPMAFFPIFFLFHPNDLRIYCAGWTHTWVGIGFSCAYTREHTMQSNIFRFLYAGFSNPTTEIRFGISIVAIRFSIFSPFPDMSYLHNVFWHISWLEAAHIELSL